METFKHLKRWTLPDCYAGAAWPEHYVFLGQHRDSDSLTRSNFTAGLAELGGESDTVTVVHESHWAVGWVEWIAIHESDTVALASADKMLSAIEDYPALNEDHWGELEWSEAADYWARMGVRQRAEYIREADCGASIFAARRDDIPRDDNGALFELLRA